MLLSELDYDLPEDRIAQSPIEPRDQSRLLVVDRATGNLTDRHFFDLPNFLGDGDVLVLNDTQVLPARVDFVKSTKGKVEGLFLRQIDPGRWEMMFKGMAKLRSGLSLFVEGSDARFTLADRLSEKTFEVRVDPPVTPVDFLNHFGQPPLPPYIRKGKAATEDRSRYQTVYGAKPGAVAAPTAGMHFTPQLLGATQSRDVQIARLTLHVGLGTFEPVTATDLHDHKMHAEWYEITDEAAQTINAAREFGKKIVAVGTTSVRVLETMGSKSGVLPGSGWTDIFIYPPYHFKIVDRLVTNFHLPRTTLLAMIYAFAGKELTRQAYQHAINEHYRFYSYGDAMMIL